MNWQLQWVSRALYTDPLNLFNGNTFHPHPNVIALTDHMLSLAVINAPLSMLTYCSHSRTRCGRRRTAARR